MKRFKPILNRYAVMVACLGLLLPRFAAADIYSFTDQEGTAHFSDAPTDPRYRLFLRVVSMENRGTKDSVEAAAKLHRYRRYLDKAAHEHGLDPALLYAIVAVESGYNPNAQSPKNARGLMQLMPETARRYGVSDPFDPEQNIRGGTRYLRDLLNRFRGNVSLALAAYNAGEDAVSRYREQVPPYAETQAYVPKVLAMYQKLTDNLKELY